jgi:flagellar hook-associated protein 1 FlgK
MRIPTFEGLQTALTGLMAYQDAIDNTGQNIANAQTPGYTRQRVLLETMPPISVPAISPTDGSGAIVGTGVGVETITRVRNAYLEGQSRSAATALGAASTTVEFAEQVQNDLHEPGASGLAGQLSAFWSAWNALANAPTSVAARENVISAGKQVAETLNGLSTQITKMMGEASTRYATLTGENGEVEADAKQLATLNEGIRLAKQAGYEPNELLDQREALVGKLSKLAQTTVTEGEDGMITVRFGTASKPLVEGTRVRWPQTLTEGSGGELGTLLSLSSAGGPLGQLRGALNGVAEALAKTVNANQPEHAFFSYTAENAAATIAVAESAEQIQTGAAGQPGANEHALAIAGLRGGEADSLYEGFVSRVGREVQTAKLQEANAEATKEAVAAQWQATSGVSVDEEMTNLITFQRGYEASARVMTAMDEMINTLINKTL